MGQEIATTQAVPALLTKSLTPQELDKHRADLCLVMELMVRKYDKFGWDRMEPGMRKLIRLDWLDALQDYELDEIRAACRFHTLEQPNKVPNEGHIKAIILRERAKRISIAPKPSQQESRGPRVTRERAAEIMAERGIENRFKSTRGPVEAAQ